jgi:hypothetical protein
MQDPQLCSLAFQSRMVSAFAGHDPPMSRLHVGPSCLLSLYQSAVLGCSEPAPELTHGRALEALAHAASRGS